MSAHPTPEVLEAFALGDVGDHTAVAVAEHLDRCARCRAAVALADPLARAFASVDDPPVPDVLVSRVLAAAQRQREAPSPQASWLPGAVLLVVAAALVAPHLEPAALVRVARHLGDLSRAAATLAAKPWFAPSLAVLAAVCGVAALWTAALPRRRAA